MGFNQSAVFGNPGNVKKKFKPESFASNNGYRLYRLFYSVQGSDVDANNVGRVLMGRDTSSFPAPALGIELQGFDLGDIIISPKQWQVSGTVFAGDGQIYMRAGESNLEDANNVIQTNRTLLFNDNGQSGNFDCQNATSAAAFGPSQFLKIGNTGTNDTWRLFIKNCWAKDSATGDDCNVSASLELLIYIKPALVRTIRNGVFPQADFERLV